MLWRCRREFSFRKMKILVLHHHACLYLPNQASRRNGEAASLLGNLGCGRNIRKTQHIIHDRKQDTPQVKHTSGRLEARAIIWAFSTEYPQRTIPYRTCLRYPLPPYPQHHEFVGSGSHWHPHAQRLRLCHPQNNFAHALDHIAKVELRRKRIQQFRQQLSTGFKAHILHSA